MLLWYMVSTCHHFELKKSSTVIEFAWKDMPAGTTFCDVGGGIGSVSMELAKAHLHLKVILQDRPTVIEQARDVSCFLFLLNATLIVTCSVLE